MERPAEADNPGEALEPQNENGPTAALGLTDDEFDKMTQPFDPALLAFLGLC
jgi:hypothetical protein